MVCGPHHTPPQEKWKFYNVCFFTRITLSTQIQKHTVTQLSLFFEHRTKNNNRSATINSKGFKSIHRQRKQERSTSGRYVPHKHKCTIQYSSTNVIRCAVIIAFCMKILCFASSRYRVNPRSLHFQCVCSFTSQTMTVYQDYIDPKLDVNAYYCKSRLTLV